MCNRAVLSVAGGVESRLASMEMAAGGRAALGRAGSGGRRRGGLGSSWGRTVPGAQTAGRVPQGRPRGVQHLPRRWAESEGSCGRGGGRLRVHGRLQRCGNRDHWEQRSSLPRGGHRVLGEEQGTRMPGTCKGRPWGMTTSPGGAVRRARRSPLLLRTRRPGAGALPVSVTVLHSHWPTWRLHPPGEGFSSGLF